MKRNILLILILFSCVMSFAQTTDKIVITCEAQNVNPGMAEYDYYVTVSLKDGSDFYTGYQMDIVLPEGLEVDKDDEGNLFVEEPFSESSESLFYPCYKNGRKWSYYHTISSSFGEAAKNTLRISCMSSTDGKVFKTKNGDLFSFCLRVNTMAKPGVVNMAMTDCKLIREDATYVRLHEATTDAITVTNSATANINISKDVKWSTCILPFGVAEIPAGFKAYSCNSTRESSLVLNPVSTMAAYTPYILYSEAGCNETLTGTVNVSAYPAEGTATEGYITGAVAQTTVSSGYVLQKQDGEVKFYMIGNSTPISVPAGKCWVNVPNSMAKASFGITFGSPTGINSVQNDGSVSSACYNIVGMKVAKPQEGQIYIVNGKKHIAE